MASPFSDPRQGISSNDGKRSRDQLRLDVDRVLDQLPDLEHGAVIAQIFETLVRMSEQEAERLDWKILSYSLLDMEEGFKSFFPYRHIRKVTIFGSARTPSELPEYQMATEFARRVVNQGFMVMTGAGGGIMQAGNEGAGRDRSFGLNIQLPFEQGANPVITGDPKLLDFKYFFTRKLFFLKESDAIALFPGGFGTQDEAFESLTLIQTGKANPMPLVLIDKPGGDYWKSWDHYIRNRLLDQGLISPDDTSLYHLTDSLDDALKYIEGFYRMYHSSRYVRGQLVVRLKAPLCPGGIEQLNDEFSDILSQGQIREVSAFDVERGDETEALPRLALHFNQRDAGRLNQMIRYLGQLGVSCDAIQHPEKK
ncbi:MAG: LOG family protein [Cyanobacteria bacterium P01_F01_bin.53]